MKFSVLISVYHKDHPEYLKKALISVYTDQVLKPTEIVLVKDGNLNNELDKVIEDFYLKYPDILKVFSLSVNMGLANALNYGVNKCHYNLIARMDSDDIAFPIRFEKQIDFMKINNLDIVGGQIIEFGADTTDVISERKVPLEHDEIVKFLKTRSPFSHPTIIFKKDVFKKIGGYDRGVFPEDYDYFVRAFLDGFKFGNIKESVLWFRVGSDKQSALKRRHGIKYAKNEFKLYKKFYRIGYYNLFDFLKVILFKLPLRLLPFPLFSYLYYNIFRKI